MFSFSSILQSVSRTLGIAIFTVAFTLVVVSFSITGFFGGGHNALAAYAGTVSNAQKLEEAQEEEVNVQPETSTETIELLTEAKLQFQLSDPMDVESGQKLVGTTLARDVETTRQLRELQKEVVEKTRDEIRKAEEEAEEAARREAIAAICSPEDYEVLKRIVEAEAGICDMKGRILVANVIMNRVRNGQFPNTITSVVYQKSQFSPVKDGRINSCKVTEETVEAVNRALAGEDYSDGALYFMNRNRSRSKNVSWFDNSLTYLFYHDKHEFFK